MIQEFVDAFMANKEALRAQFAKGHPDCYGAIVRAVVSVLGEDRLQREPDPERIHEIDDGSYQGTLVFVIAEKGYQPDDYWYVKVGYGSCSGCDTLESIADDGHYDEPPNEKQIDEYLTLALHIVQGLKLMGEP